MNLTMLYLLITLIMISLVFIIIKSLSFKEKFQRLDNLVEEKNEIIESQNRKIEDLKRNIKIKLKKARNVHQRMLPDTLAEPDDFFFSDYYQPAEYIGGDYYNIFKIDHGAMNPFFKQHLVYFFDVSGHGIDSTLLSIFVNDSIENYFKLQHSPGEKISTSELMNYIDQQYQKEDFPDDYLVCLFIAVLDDKNHTLRYSSGGFQYPIYKVNAENGIEKINIGGLPISTALGALTDSREEKKINFVKNTTLVLSTDGLLEQSNGPDIYFDKFTELLNKYHFLPAPFLKDLIRSDFYNFINGDPGEDDITFLLLERPAGEIFNYQLDTKNQQAISEQQKDIKEELIEFLNQIQWRKITLLNEIKEIAFKLIENADLKLKVKALNNQDLFMLSFEKDKNSINWDFVFNEYPELTSIAEKNINISYTESNQLSFEENELYYSHNKFNSKIYLLFFKRKL
ncbi:MAG: PP2C family protein-serine/threonine phosphatase [Bacillota bacterium]